MTHNYGLILNSGGQCLIETKAPHLYVLSHHTKGPAMPLFDCIEPEIETDIPAWLIKTLTDANDKAIAAGAQRSVDMLVVGAETAIAAHLGDGRIYGVTNSGEVKQLTTDHSWPEYQAQAHTSPAEEYRVIDGIGAVHYLGAAQFEKLEQDGRMIIPAATFSGILTKNIISIPLSEYRLLCMATGGLSYRLSDEEIKGILSSGKNGYELLGSLSTHMQYPLKMLEYYIDSLDGTQLDDMTKRFGLQLLAIEYLADQLKHEISANVAAQAKLADNLPSLDTAIMLIDVASKQRSVISDRTSTIERRIYEELQQDHQAALTELGRAMEQVDRQNLTEAARLEQLASLQERLTSLQGQITSTQASSAQTSAYLRAKIEENQALQAANSHLRLAGLSAASVIAAAMAAYYLLPP